MKKLTRTVACAVAIVACAGCVALSACNNEDSQIHEVTKEGWKAAIEASCTAESYSYLGSYDYKISDEYHIKEVLTGKINRTDDVAYYELSDNSSIFPDEYYDRFGFGKYCAIHYTTENVCVYYSAANADGSYSEWKNNTGDNYMLSTSLDILTAYNLMVFAETEDGESLGALADIYDYFTFNESSCQYSANLFARFGGDNDSINVDIKISFKNNKIYNLYWATHVNESVNAGTGEVKHLSMIYDYTFSGYGKTVVELPEELKSLTE